MRLSKITSVLGCGPGPVSPRIGELLLGVIDPLLGVEHPFLGADHILLGSLVRLGPLDAVLGCLGLLSGEILGPVLGLAVVELSLLERQLGLAPGLVVRPEGSAPP